MTDKDRIELANLLFPNIKHTRDYYEEKYPERDLVDGAMVTRYGPSPTGSVHLGNLLSAFADMVYANQSKGVFFLRIEDTDQKRMIDGGIDNITSVLRDFDILPTEGYSFGGEYGPYRQSERKDIYKKYVQQLIDADKAYENLREITKIQKQIKAAMRNKNEFIATNYKVNLLSDHYIAIKDPVRS